MLAHLASGTFKISKSDFGKWVVLIIIGLTCRPGCIAQDLVVSSEPSEVQLIGEQVVYFDDLSGDLTIDEIMSEPYQKQFIPVERDVFTAEASESATWFKMIVKNETGKDLWLQAGANTGWYLDFYRPNESNGTLDSIKTGALRPDTTKEFPSNFYLFKLADADETDARQYYLRLDGFDQGDAIICGYTGIINSPHFQL